MLTSTRSGAILAPLASAGEVFVARLAGQFSVSTSTVRRDFDMLSTQGRLQRVRGVVDAVVTHADARSPGLDRLRDAGAEVLLA